MILDGNGVSKVYEEKFQAKYGKSFTDLYFLAGVVGFSFLFVLLLCLQD
jgi:hypothetical protein